MIIFYICKNLKYYLRFFISFVNSNSEVAHHFNLKKHFTHTHFSFTVIMNDITDNDKRKSIETYLINISRY